MLLKKKKPRKPAVQSTATYMPLEVEYCGLYLMLISAVTIIIVTIFIASTIDS